MKSSLVQTLCLATTIAAYGQGNSQNAPGQGGSENGSAKAHTQISWISEAAKTEKALLDTKEAKVEFKSSGALTNVDVWLTPSLGAMTATPKSFATITKDTVYSITLKLAEAPTHSLGGTLQLRDGGESNRNYATPLPISVQVQGGSNTNSGKSSVGGVAASADYRAGSVTPGQTVSIFGQGIGPEQSVGARLDERGRVSTVASGVQVLFNGLPAPILMAVRDQINVVAPQGLASDKLADIIVMFEAKMSDPVSVTVEPLAPALFTLDGSGSGQAAALNQDGKVNGGTTRARRGEAVTLFGSGFGEFSRAVPDGTVTGSDLTAPKAEVSVTIGGVPAKLLYAGSAPGLVAGVIQINVEVPQGVAAGDRVSVAIQAGAEQSTRTVSIAID